MKALFSGDPGHLAGSFLSKGNEPNYIASCGLSPTPLQNAMYLALVPLHFASVAVVSFIFPPEIS